MRTARFSFYRGVSASGSGKGVSTTPPSTHTPFRHILLLSPHFPFTSTDLESRPPTTPRLIASCHMQWVRVKHSKLHMWLSAGRARTHTHLQGNILALLYILACSCFVHFTYLTKGIYFLNFTFTIHITWIIVSQVKVLCGY